MSFRPRQKGNAMMEFALGATILFATFAGTFQFGYTFYQYNLLEHAVNQGARYASMKPYDSTTATPTDAFKTAVRNVVVYGDPTGTNTSAVVRNLTTANVNVSATFTNGIPSAVTVSIS